MACNNCSCNQDTYEEFVPYKEYHVGAFFKIGNEVFKVVVDEEGECKLCEFLEVGDICKACICSEAVRNDEVPILFILYDTLNGTEDET